MPQPVVFVDWQIAACSVRPDVLMGNPIAALSRWKIFDNLRRSLLPALRWRRRCIGCMAEPSSATTFAGRSDRGHRAILTFSRGPGSFTDVLPEM